MSITIRQLHYLIAVAEHHSFTRAAAHLYVSQPTLSQQLIQLEESLQTQLLERTRGDVRLTQAGQVYVAHVMRALGDLREGSRALCELENLRRGEIRIGMVPPAVVLMAPALTRFAELYPGIELSIMERDQEDIHQGLVNGDIDLGIGFHMTSGPAQNTGIKEIILCNPKTTWLVGKKNLNYGRTEPLTPNDLQGATVVLLSRGFALRRHIDSYCTVNRIGLKVSMEVNSIAMLVEAVASGGLGTFCFEAFGDHDRGIFSVPLEPEIPPQQVVALRKGDGYESMACRAFLASILR